MDSDTCEEVALPNPRSCSIANVSISTLIEDRMEDATFGTTPVEECSCPAGYRGLSCQQWLVKLNNICLTNISSCVIIRKLIKTFKPQVGKRFHSQC